MPETQKTTLLALAAILTGVGGAYLASADGFYKGLGLIGLSVAILIIRGYLKKKGIEALSK